MSVMIPATACSCYQQEKFSFSITGPSWGETIGDQWIPLTKCQRINDVTMNCWSNPAIVSAMRVTHFWFASTTVVAAVPLVNKEAVLFVLTDCSDQVLPRYEGFIMKLSFFLFFFSFQKSKSPGQSVRKLCMDHRMYDLSCRIDLTVKFCTIYGI